MRIFLMVLISVCGIFTFSHVSFAAESMACTREYAPVCSWSGGQKQTYSNSCVAKSQGVTDATAEACDLIPVDKPMPSIITGGDTDKHGCKASAGYTWSPLAKTCIQPWMSKIQVLTIAPEQVGCTGVSPMSCFQVKTGLKPQDWSNFYNSISGFSFQSGTIYRLLVLATNKGDTPADASSIDYSLIRIISQKKSHAGLEGKWTISSFQKDVTASSIKPSEMTVDIDTNTISAKICNYISMDYVTKDGVLTTKPAISTLMYCTNTMEIENAWHLDGAIYSVSADKKVLKITTKNGAIFTLTR